MDIKQLRYFVTIADMKGFSLAAKYLFVTQSTLSKSLQNLENELGVQLIYFVGKKMYITNYGTDLYNMAKPLLGQHDAILDAMHGLTQLEKGIIRVGVPPIIGTVTFPKLIADFIEVHPGIEFLIDQHNAIDIQHMVANHLLDIGLTILPLLYDSFDILHIMDSTYDVVMNKKNPLAQNTSLSYSDLKRQSFILLGETYRVYHDVLTGCRQSDYEPHVLMRLNTWDLILEFVRINMGISILPHDIVAHHPCEDIVGVPLANPVEDWKVVMVTSKTQYETIALKALKEHIRKR